MTPRRRSNAKRGWPRGLLERKGYFSWVHPHTGTEYGLGRDRAAAFAQAVEANLKLAKVLERERLVDRISGDGKSRTVAAWFEKYETLLAKRELAANTRRGYKSMGARATTLFGSDTKLRALTALTVTDKLDEVAAAGQERTAQALRGFLHESFRTAIVQGWLDQNPVRDVRGTAVHVKRGRLTLGVFLAVYRSGIATWLHNAMALALVSAQRREDVALARFADVREGAWWVVQGKTGARIAIPGELRLDAFGMSLDEVVKQCRSTGVLSKHLVHQTAARGNSPVGKPIWKDTLSRCFSDAVTALKLDFDGKDAPTFHEIRSLSERLYSAQGGVNTQELLGHKNARMTEVYHDGRGAWVKVTLGAVR